MKLVNKNILLISPESWNHIFVSKHHYATHLASRGNIVFFLNPPSKKVSCKKTDFENVFSVNYKGFIPGLRFYPSLIQKYIIQKKFEALQKLCQAKFDIVWSFDNSVFFDFSALPKNVDCISHIVDLNQNFKFKKSSATANLCLASSKYIVEKQKKYNHNSHNIGHGFNKIEGDLKQVELQGSNKINCGYAGNLDIQYIDWELMEKLLFNNPDVDFHFAGQWKSKSKFIHICERTNFHYYGKLSANNLPEFYNSMDALILIYLYNKYPKQLANPHKMMEYLASGKMILATWTEEYKSLHIASLIKMVKSKQEYLTFFQSILKNLHSLNNQISSRRRKAFVLNKTYEKQIEQIEQLLF